MGGTDAVVAGAGPAGLATAAMLKRAGLSTTILERSDAVGSSWRARYDGLRLNTIRWSSSLPGYRMERKYGRWPTRDEWVGYLERYADRHGLDVRFGTELRRVERSGEGWRLETSNGSLDAGFAVVAIGHDHDPKIPRWSGLDSFTGELMHAASYRNPEPFAGKDVMIVGPGNTGSELAYKILRGGAGRVRASMRGAPNVIKREVLGLPLYALVGIVNNRAPVAVSDFGGRLLQRAVFGDLSKYGVPRAPMGVATSIRDRRVAPLFDDGFVDALKRGEIQILPVIERFDGPDVVLAGGERIQPDVVIACTGYDHGLEPIVGHLGVLDDQGSPRVRDGKDDPRTPGLRFTGYTPHLAGQLCMFKYEARRIARAARRDLA